MSTVISDSTGYRRVVGSPNERADEKPGSYRQSQALKFKFEPDYPLVPGAPRPTHWRERIWQEEDRELYAREATQRQLSFAQQALKSEGQSQLQIEMNLKLHHFRHGSNLKPWRENEFDADCARIAGMFWWRHLPFLDDEGGSLDIFSYRIAEDPHFAEEVARGDWN